MNSPEDSLLGREVAYPSHYDASLLFPIPRVQARREIDIDDAALPFIGHDRWHAYELSWLDAHGKPRAGTATFMVPCDSPNLVESKSLKLYLNSLNAERFRDDQEAFERIAADLSRTAGAAVTVTPGLPPLAEDHDDILLDELPITIDHYGPPTAGFLSCLPDEVVEETLVSHLLKSNCPVTGQPDWASVILRYRGPRIDREGLLRYLISYRDHAEFHEQCVERIFKDVLERCLPASLSVEARYTRRGGLDINPWRATPGCSSPAPLREIRQ